MPLIGYVDRLKSFNVQPIFSFLEIGCIQGFIKQNNDFLDVFCFVNILQVIFNIINLKIIGLTMKYKTNKIINSFKLATHGFSTINEIMI